MKQEAWFFVGLLVLIFVLWFIFGSKPSFAVPSPPTLAIGTTTAHIGLPQAPFQIGHTYIQLSLPGSGSGANGASESGSGSASEPPPIEGVAFGTPSPYRGTVSLSRGVSGAGASNPDNEYLVLTVAQNAAAPVTISGWSVESAASGNAALIPGGAPEPLSGTVNDVAPITIEPGGRAYLISGRSPIGASFLENKCIGYFSQFQHFSPSLPQNCPTPENELAAHYPDYIRDAACINYVNTVPRCSAQLSAPVSVSGACQTFLTTYLNYNGCVMAHQNDADFIGTTWHVYLGRTAAMWRTRNEVVKLLDAQGKTVDAFSY